MEQQDDEVNALIEIQNPAADDWKTFLLNEPAKWNRAHEILFDSDNDTLQQICLRIKVGPAPQGYRWKRCWSHFFFKRLYLSIGGTIVFDTCTESLQMEHLIRGSRGRSECVFDFDEAERTERSRESHEVLVEPFRLKEIIASKYAIPMLRLYHHHVKMEFTSGSLADCLEPIADMPPPLPQGNQANEFLKGFEANALYTVLDITESRVLRQLETTSYITKHMDYASDIFEKGANNKVSIRVNQSEICSAAYMWITDDQGKELPRSVVERIQIKFNNNPRLDLNELQSRHIVRLHVPHPTIENKKSQNLYYISYWCGRTSEDGLEQGVNHTRIDHITWNLYLKLNAPQRFKIHICHRSQNILKTLSGVGGMVFGARMCSISQIRETVVAEQYNNVLDLLGFPDPNKDITIPVDDKMCMITYLDFEEGQSVDQCGQCRKIFSTQGMRDWLKNRPRDRWKCVHCQAGYESFIRGKARLFVQTT